MDIHLSQNLVECSFVRHVEHHPQIDSTNNRARRLALGQEPLLGHATPSVEILQKSLSCLILADQQSAGRGRGGNRWWTGPGSLAMSLLMPPLADWPRLFQRSPRQSSHSSCDPAEEGPFTSFHASRPAFQPGLIGLAAALAVLRTVHPRLPAIELGLHWPNDVFAAGKKLAGVLVEIVSNGLVVVGIGVNTNNTCQEAPEELRPRAATLRDLTGQPYPHEEFLPELLGRLEQVFQSLVRRPQQTASEADQWCLQKERPLTVQIPEGMVYGICQGIGPEGELLLKTPEGVRRIFSGSIR
ncbi:MAG TPA: biotin--[acetyl-CoA-carboxylase] ligase [Thermoguttaceae bacterium]|nr:biotin--[acetyl-CoA-carboxylase] ligase [Thermoguttaceae bacterium]